MTPSHPIALSPSGPTTTDTVAHVTTLEGSQKDVTTKFVGSLAVEKNDERVTTFGSPNFVKAMTTEFMMTLKKALCRPVQLATGTWATTDIVGSNLFLGEIPDILFAQSIFSKKLDGFQGVRGSITLRLQVTANPFQQGLIKLAFYPLYSTDKTFLGRSQAAESWSFWPNVELNLGKETACELRVPFTLPVSFCDLVTNIPNDVPQMGLVMVRIYCPLQVGAGTSTVGWNLYGHWNEDDLELFNPTPNIYQSGRSHKLTSKSSLPSDKEKHDGTISGALGAASVVAEIATAVPVLADFAGPTEWALRVASRVASALGFARPQIDENPRLVVPFDFPYSANVEGPDSSMPLSQTVEPSLKIEPKLSGKNEDEMSIDYFVTKFGFRSTITLDSSSVADTVIYNLPLQAGNFTGIEANYPKPYQMLALLYKYWRGNFRVRIKFIKTKMHTARLAFAFYPGVTSNQSLAQSEYVHREIVDIATVEELVYELPFTTQFPYLSTDTTLDNRSCYGSFQIVVVNQLQAPASVPSSINMIVETAMGEGSEWFMPRDLNTFLPIVPVEAVASSTLVKRSVPPPPSASPIREPTNRFQSGETPPVVQVTTLSDAKVTGHQTETAQLCVGEKLLSLRQIIKYPANLSFSPSVTATTSAAGTTPAICYNPFFIGATNTIGTHSVQPKDVLNLLAPYYRFSRGGMRVRGSIGGQRLTTQYNHTGFLSFTAKNADIAGMLVAEGASQRPMFGGDFQRPDAGFFKYLLPAWQNVPMVPHWYTLNNSTPPYTQLMRRQSALVLQATDLQPSTDITIRVARQPADDYELLSFVGPAQYGTPVS